MNRTRTIALAALGALALASAAGADHVPGSRQRLHVAQVLADDHGVLQKASDGDVTYAARAAPTSCSATTARTTSAAATARTSCGATGIPPASRRTQKDVIYGGNDTDFIYGSHGYNEIYAGNGNDVISVHYGRGRVDCGPGRDIYHVARSRKSKYRFLNCEKVDYRARERPRRRRSSRSRSRSCIDLGSARWPRTQRP